jgi:cytochrome c oxidase assembly factor CtaG
VNAGPNTETLNNRSITNGRTQRTHPSGHPPIVHYLLRRFMTRSSRRSTATTFITAALVFRGARLARADAGVPIGPGETWQAWNWDPVLLLNLAVLWWLYGRGLARLWSRAGTGHGVSVGRPLAFLGSIAVISLALISPLDALSGQLASAHMVQHLLLLMVAAPLFVLGAPAQVLTRGLSPPWQRAAASCRRNLRCVWFRVLWQPVFAWTAYAAVLWLWHLPSLYEAALRHPIVHDAQHLSFFGAACLFWRPLLDPAVRQRLHPVPAVFYLFTTSLQASALGIFLSLSLQTWYAAFHGTTAAWGLTPLEDQQLAGLIMWMPACLIYALAAVAVFGIWLARQAESMDGGPVLMPSQRPHRAATY